MQSFFVGHPLTSSHVLRSRINLVTPIYLKLRYLSTLFISF
nr:MAG TPA: hypothetical protein [Caudoviricetes sp.]